MFHARLPARLLIVLQVAVREGDEPPCQGEYDPADGEGHGEEQQVPSPLDVDHRREDVGQEASTSPVDVHSRDVTLAVLADQTTLGHSRQQPPETILVQHGRHLRACAVVRSVRFHKSPTRK